MIGNVWIFQVFQVSRHKNVVVLFFLRGWYTHVLIIGISPGVTLSFFSSLVRFVLLYYSLFYCSSDGYIGPSADFGILQTC